MIFFEAFYDIISHVTELTAVAFIKNHHDMLIVNRMAWIAVDEIRQLLNGCNNDPCIRVFQLLFENCCTGVTVRAAFFKAVIFLHCLIVEIFSVDNKQHFINVRQLARSTSCSEGSEGFSAACGMPDITSRRDGSVFLVVCGNFYAIQYPFCRSNLVWTHHQQQIFRRENTVFCENIQNGMLGKEGACEVYQIGNNAVVCICPEAGKLKTITGFLLFCHAAFRVFDSMEPCTVGIILGVCSV